MTAPRQESLKDLHYKYTFQHSMLSLNLDDDSCVRAHQHDVCLPASPVVTLLTSAR